jgi:hypothetical protein
LAQGPDEKWGRAGRLAGLSARATVARGSNISHLRLSSQRARAALGRRGPGALIKRWREVSTERLVILVIPAITYAQFDSFRPALS